MKNGEQTKALLAATLKELMANRPLEKISIKELAEAAQVNRQTFYYHFEDIYDLLKWTLQEEVIQLLAQQEGAGIWQEGLLQLFRYIEDNRAFATCALESVGHKHLKRFFYADINNIIGKVVQDVGNDMRIPEEHMNFLTHYYTISLAAMVVSWLQQEMDHTPEQLIQMIDTIIMDQLNGALHRMKKDHTE